MRVLKSSSTSSLTASLTDDSSSTSSECNHAQLNDHSSPAPDNTAEHTNICDPIKQWLNRQSIWSTDQSRTERSEHQHSSGVRSLGDKKYELFTQFLQEAEKFTKQFTNKLLANRHSVLYQSRPNNQLAIDQLLPLPIPLSGVDMANKTYALCRATGGTKQQGYFAYKEILKLVMGQDAVKYFKQHQPADAKAIGLQRTDTSGQSYIAMRYGLIINLAAQSLNDERKGVHRPQVQNMLGAYFKANLEMLLSLRETSTHGPEAAPDSQKNININTIPLPLSAKTLMRPTWGSSSSHGMGPASLAEDFLKQLYSAEQSRSVDPANEIIVKAYGSLGATGKAHNLHLNVICSLHGVKQEDLSSDYGQLLETWEKTGKVVLEDGRSATLRFEWIPEQELLMPSISDGYIAPNGIIFSAINPAGQTIVTHQGYSIGGGFTLTTDQIADFAKQPEVHKTDAPADRTAFRSAQTLLTAMEHNKSTNLTAYWLAYERSVNKTTEADLLKHTKRLATLILSNYKLAPKVPEKIANIDHQLQARIHAKANMNGIADEARQALSHASQAAAASMAVASTAGCVCWGKALQVPLSPTIGSAGVIPATFVPLIQKQTGLDVTHTPSDTLLAALGDQKLLDFFAGATIGLIMTKLQSSHAAAAHGCMGEVGNSSISATMGYLNAALEEPTPFVDTNGTAPFFAQNFGKLSKILNAAENVMHFYDGLTCTPIQGRVGSPCNVRNEQSFVPIMAAIDAADNTDVGGGYPMVLQAAKHFDQGALDQDIIGKRMSNALRETDEESILTGTGDGVLPTVRDIEDLGQLG